ncbi:hypothetical protein G7Y89_g14987 [Cudoniella acicularis]|uniref:Uncharacterized protein n=1 Tax=Cudoniella acicularis TaxID=354080 RepID=A0A8H4VS71_9HELO|nr:hypothetical protein G7Y89_g14987 [Cudoniella acicularis]
MWLLAFDCCKRIGVAGIYDLRLIRDTHASIPAYQDFLVGAFGTDEKVWDEVSPAKFKWFKEAWPKGKKLSLVSSKNDELVDGVQINSMNDVAEDLKGKGGVEVEVLKDVLRERHNAIWENAVEMASVIAGVLKGLNS